LEIIDVGDVHGGQIAVGKVVKPHGIKGELKVYPFSGRPDDFLGYPQLILAGPGHGPARSYAVEQARILGGLAILQLAGLADRNMAESLRGFEVRIARELLPAPGPGTFYWHELAGLSVITDDGQALGRITSLLATSAHDILVINGGRGEYLIPFIAQCVAGLAPDGKALIVTPPPGLLEMNVSGVSGRAG
jgi:16S rRNA processing protein RimM